MGKVKFGIIGLGNIANSFCGDLVRSDNAMIYAVASRTMGKADAFAKKYSAQKAYNKYEDIYMDKNVDIIYIATPHNFHKEIAINCMENGKAVLCEKPAGINENELQEMIDCAKSNDVFFMEGMWTRFFPISQKIKEIVASNELGNVRHIEASFGFGSWDNENTNNENHRLFSPQLAGGGILDLGVYPVAFTTWITGKAPNRIKTLANMTSLGVDGNTVGIFEYDDNCLAMIQFSICQQTSCEGKIYFDKGKIELEKFFSPSSMLISRSDGSSKMIEDDFLDNGYHGFIYQIDHVAQCFKNGLKMSPYHTWDESLEIVRIMDEMRKQIGLEYPFE